MSDQNNLPQQSQSQGITNTLDGQQINEQAAEGAANQAQPQTSQGNEQDGHANNQVPSATQSPPVVAQQNNQSLGESNLQVQPTPIQQSSNDQQKQQEPQPSSIAQGLDQVNPSTNTLNPESKPTNEIPLKTGNSEQLTNLMSGGATDNMGQQVIQSSNQSVANPAIPRYTPFVGKIRPRFGQGLGRTGASIPQDKSNAFIEVVKTGDLEKFQGLFCKEGIEVRDVITDQAKFKQNLIFAAIQISTEDQAIVMIKHLCELGVDVTQMDNLKQSPLYYTCRDGKIKLCQFLIEQGVDVNLIDIYGQNAIYYAVNLGHIDVVKLLKQYGSDHDHRDENGQTPVYYAIKSNRPEVLETLLQYSCNLQITDNRGNSPMQIAMRNKSTQLKDLLLKYGAQLPPDQNKRPPKGDKKPVAPQVIDQKKRINEKLIPKDFVLQIFDGEQYRPITQFEFDKFSQSHPELSKFFTDENEIDKLHTPQVDESVPIYHHWEKVASRMLSILMRKHEAWIFLEPVDAHKLGIPDYFRLIQKPMDLGTVKENLRKHEYKSMQQFTDDVTLIFSNCYQYNGENSQVGQMCQKVKEEYWLQYEQLNVEFYLCDNIFK